MSTKEIYTLSVGIGRYQHLGALSCATNDAQDLATVISGGAIPSEVRLLLDADATKEAILKGLRWLASSVRPDDTAIVFFSGHGGRRSLQESHAFFCPVEASSLNLDQTGITSVEFTDALRAIRSERLVVLLDTCYSGGIGEPRHHALGIRIGFKDGDVNALIEGSGRIILAASRPDELAWELSGMRNGLFTNYVLRALCGEVARTDGSIWASEIFSYVSRSMRQYKYQHPYQKAVGEDFVVMVQSNRANRPAEVLDFILSENDQRPLRMAMRRVYNRDELSLLCRDLGLSLDELPGRTLETQLMDLIDYCHRHGKYRTLLKRVQMDRPELILGG
jgi:hypothetical protein